MARYTLVHSALLWVEDEVTHDLEAAQGTVFDEKDLPAAALKRGLETGALEPVGKAETEGAPAADGAAAPKPKPLGRMNLTELKAYAAEKNIGLGSAKTKKQLVAAIKAAEKSG